MPRRADVPSQVRAAVGVIWLESLALFAAAAILVTKTVVGDPSDVTGALLAALLAFGGGLLLGAAGRGLLRLRAAARTPVIVLELLALPVAYSLAFQASRVEYGGPILVAALAVLYLLFTPPARAALDREPD